MINKKVKKVLKEGLNPVLCIGETKEEYEAGLNREVCMHFVCSICNIYAMCVYYLFSFTCTRISMFIFFILYYVYAYIDMCYTTS